RSSAGGFAARAARRTSDQRRIGRAGSGKRFAANRDRAAELRMLAEILVVTRLLGLVTGKQPFEAQVPANVRAVEVVSDGKTLAMLRGKPWQTIIDFGPELEPHEVPAVAYDENGAEIARDTQLVNLARPSAEAVIVLDRHPRSGAVMATVRWQHIASAKPKRIRWTLDRQLVGKGETV